MSERLHHFLKRWTPERRRLPLMLEKNYEKVFTFYRPLLERVKQTYFPPDAPVQINHEGFKKPEQSGIAIDFLRRAGLSEEFLSHVFTSDGKLQEVRPDGVDVWTFTSIDDATAYVYSKMSWIDRMVNSSLDEGLKIIRHSPYGFNRHQGDHEWDVNIGAQTNLQYAAPYRRDITPDVYINAAIASIVHDDGNAFGGRAEHSVSSVALLEHGIPGIETNSRFARVALSIIAHDPPRLKEYLQTQEAMQDNGGLNIDRASAVMARDLPPEALAIIASDRGQFGRRRVPDVTHSTDAYGLDPNIFPQVVWEADLPAINRDTYTFTLRFNPVIQQDSTFYSWAGRDSKRATYIGRKRVHVPQHMHDALKQNGTSYSLTAERDWLQVYGNDYLAIQIAAVFALNPKIQTFQLLIEDPLIPQEYSQEGTLRQRVRTFHRGSLQHDFEEYQRQLEKQVQTKIA